MTATNDRGSGTAVRFGLVGCGRIAQAHLEAMSEIPQATLTVAVDIRQETAAATAERYGSRHFDEYKDPAILDLVDAVVVCTPPSTHREVVGYFLSQNIAVLCEKPLALTSADARSLVALSSTRETPLMMASKFRYVEDVIKAKSLIEAGALGRVILYENAFCSRVNMSERWNAEPEIAGGGVIIDNGSHSVDIVRYLLGPIVAVEGLVGESVQGLAVEDTARLQIRTKRGAMVSIDLSWAINKESPHYISVYGSEGTLEIGWKGSRYRIEGAADWIPFGKGYGKIASLRSQLENFVGALRGNEKPLITPTDALASVEVIEKAYESLREGRPIPLNN